MRAYESGLLEDLAPGVAAPVAYAIHHGADGELRLWLEDVEEKRRRLARRDVLATARHRRLAGRWIVRVPKEPWLFTGWLDRHGQPEAVEAALRRLADLRSAESLEARPGWSIESAVDLIERQGEIRSILAEIPETLCHHDAVASNVFPRRRDGERETLLIDWESVGPGPVGADLASLLFSSARRGDLSTRAVSGGIDAALEAYAAGLRDMGAAVGKRSLEVAVHAAICLRWKLARDVIVGLEDGVAARRGSAPDEPPERALDELIALSRLLFASALAVPRRGSLQ